MISPLNSTFLRAFLRMYFILTLLLLGLFGSQCCKCANKLKLLRDRSVSLIHMTGWLRISEIVVGTWNLRRLPGGPLLGSMMLAASGFALIADLATSTLVYSTTLPSRCEFQSGLVMNGNSSSWASPPPNGKAALVAQNAQIISVNNGCDMGIYNKASFEAFDFCADETDILGTWTCQDVKQDMTFSSSLTTAQIMNTLYTQNLQYYYGYSNADYSRDGHTTHFLAWSSSIGDQEIGATNSGFEVKASIDQGSSYTTDKIIKSYHCTAESDYDLSQIKKVLGGLQPNSTLFQWIDGLPAVIYDGTGTSASNKSASYLAQRLNTMTMVEGGDGSINGVLAPEDDDTYGCVILQTYIHPFVLFLALVAALSLIGMLVWWIMLLLRLGKDHGALKPFPNNLLTWMSQAARESAGMGPLVPGKVRDLREWEFDVVAGAGERNARLVNRHANAQLPQMAAQGMSWGSSGVFVPAG